jgi:hypothetical protein
MRVTLSFFPYKRACTRTEAFLAYLGVGSDRLETFSLGATLGLSPNMAADEATHPRPR